MIKKLSEKYQQWNYFRKSKKTQAYSFKGIKIKILPGVFSPEGTRTTELFASYLLNEDWNKKKVLELGAGSGLLSFLLCQKGAEVTASDISENAIDGIKQNSQALDLNVHAINSNLFEKLNERFDIIIINPPFFQKDPKSIAESAWYCGKNFDYFIALFEQFSQRDLKEQIWMILSENADIEMIESIALSKGLAIQDKVNLETHDEKHVVFKISNK
ncbi:Ribosomal RNA small subunit methyltransferase C [Parvicella tangerina]|uniref:Ribosomal RNA small subunit methyltransferase C n=2 Tax=Parvicella tangerina TaxID=2829795 RepID=A0A916NPC2_9FLAO|nr:Ribosomal RNA small subunit methyltransferase C [Parvicella tangerina]